MGMLSFESEVTFVAILLFLLPVTNSNRYEFLHICIFEPMLLVRPKWNWEDFFKL